MSIRQYIFELLKNDPTLNGLGIDGNTLFNSYAPDSPAASGRWVVLRWGEEEAPLGRDTDLRRKPLTVWAYDVEPDYSAVLDILKRARALIYPLKGVNVGNGWISEVGDNGTSADLFDPTYNAVTKNRSFSFAASGE